MFAEEFRDAAGFGWLLPSSDPSHDWRALMTKKAAEVERLNGVYNRLLTQAGVNMIEGRGRLGPGPHTVTVDLAGGKGTRVLTARHILIATGGRPVKAPIPGAEHAITSDEALALASLPTRPADLPVVIVGAGYISVEFAGIFAGLGARVHLIYRKNLPLAGFDNECRAHVAHVMAGRGIGLHPRSTPLSITKNPDGSFDVAIDTLPDTDGDGDGAENGSAGAAPPPQRPPPTRSVIRAGLVMFGTGRAPNTEGLGLAEAGVRLTPGGAIAVDAYSRTSVPGVWAIGDVTDRLALTPVALMEGMAFVESALGPRLTRPVYSKIATACFVQPPLAACGLTEEAAIERLAGPVDVYVSAFKPMRNTLSGRDERTLMKLVVDGTTDEVVGAHMVGPDAPEIMQGVAIAMRCGARKADFDGTVGIHPSAAEEFVTMRTRTRRVAGKGKGGKAEGGGAA
jgi:glutathione reductase (NADPH)